MRTVDLALRVGMLNVYVEGSTTPLPSTTLTVNTDGMITVPLLYRATTSAPWQRIERIEIAITPDMFNGFVLDATPTAFSAGTAVTWIEQRPGTFTRVVDPPLPTPTPTPTVVPTGQPGAMSPCVMLPIVTR